MRKCCLSRVRKEKTNRELGTVALIAATSTLSGGRATGVVTVRWVWQLLNTDLRELGKPKSEVPSLESSKKEGKLGETGEFGAEASKGMLDLLVSLGLLGTLAAPIRHLQKRT